MTSIQDTGVPIVDNFVGGVPFGVLDNYTIYKLPKAVDRPGVPSAIWDELASLLEDRMPDNRARWLVVHYSPIGAAAVSHTGQVSPPYSEPHRRDAAGQLKHVREDMQAPN